jgi:hypothetical protein
MKRVVVVCSILLGCAAFALANPGPPGAVPEIDPGSIVSASALIGSALIMMRRRPRG